MSKKRQLVQYISRWFKFFIYHIMTEEYVLNFEIVVGRLLLSLVAVRITFVINEISRMPSIRPIV